MRRSTRRSAFLFVAALSVASVSCGGGGDGGTGPGGGEGPTVTRIDVTPQTANLFVGKTATYTATPKDATGATVTGKAITWTSSNTSIATVSGGVVTAVGPGSATIRAAIGSVEGQGTAIVIAPVATVELSPATATIVIGATQQLAATLKDASGNVLTDRTIVWTSDNDLIATVSTSGLVTSKSVGSATITATVEGKSATAKITITPVPVATVTVTPTTSSLVIGGTVQLNAITKDAAGNTLSGRSVAWSTSDAAVASVDANGLVTAHALGSATITATSETKTATAAITVAVAPVATVAVSPSNVTVSLNGTTQLSAATSDASGHVLIGRTITWSSSDVTKATVDANGLVTGLAYGQVTITATSEGKSGTATVKVSDGVAPVLVGLTITPDPVDVTTGTKTVTATAHVTDAGGSGVAQFAITATAPHGAFANCVDTTLDSGTTSDGIWSCTFTIPVGAEPGSWSLLVLVSDVGFAAKMYGSADLTAAALPGSFTVASNWDQVFPVFHQLTVSPTTVNVAGGAQAITVSADLTDDRSGIARFDFYATSKSGQRVGCSATTPATGNSLAGTWTCTLNVPADAEAGTWLITVRATDNAFNYQTYGPQDGDGTIAFPTGYPSSITVTR